MRKISDTLALRLLSGLNATEALTEACGKGYTPIVKLLIDADVDLNTTDDYGHTPLALAAMNGHGGSECPITKDVIQLLLDAGVDVNQRGFREMTALMCAAAYGHSGVVRQLLRAGADVNQRGFGGWTALMIASMRGHVEVIRVLLSASIDERRTIGDTVALSNNNGQTAWDVTCTAQCLVNRPGRTALLTLVRQALQVVRV